MLARSNNSCSNYRYFNVEIAAASNAAAGGSLSLFPDEGKFLLCFAAAKLQIAAGHVPDCKLGEELDEPLPRIYHSYHTVRT